MNEALVLTIDRACFDLTGGLERWLYRLVRKHGGRQDGGWSFDLVHLHAKSGSLSALKHFAYELREIVRRQTHARPARCGAIELRARSDRCLCGAVAETRARSSLGGQPVNHLVLSGIGIAATAWRSISSQLRNFTNLESFGFLLTGRYGWPAVDNRR